MRLLTVALTAAALATAAPEAAAQRFVTVGAGAGFPFGPDRGSMQTGWVTEIMAGMVLPNGFSSLRVGGMYAESRIAGSEGMGGMAFMPSGTGRLVGGMVGLMAMPNWDWDWFPYVHASAGAMNASFQGTTTSFAWSSGVGIVVQWRLIDFYTEGKFVQARRAGATGEMIAITTGLRLAR
jgi:hypothetical protein